MTGFTKVIVQFNGSTKSSCEGSQCTCIDEDRSGEVSSLSSSGFRHHQEELKKHGGDTIHIIMPKCYHPSWREFEPIFLLPIANLSELI
jgi:hypothetical protein